MARRSFGLAPRRSERVADHGGGFVSFFSPFIRDRPLKRPRPQLFADAIFTVSLRFFFSSPSHISTQVLFLSVPPKFLSLPPTPLLYTSASNSASVFLSIFKPCPGLLSF